MQTATSQQRVVIVGGGISGLSAAWFLQQVGIDYVLIEASGRLGGKVLTEQIDGFVIEAGPDSFLTQKPGALQLARDLGLSDQLIPINTRAHATDVLHHGKPIHLPEGVALIVPTKFWPFVKSPLMSPLGKLRMALDWVLPAKLDDSDETLAGFVRRRLGSEAVDKLAAPLMAGIYNAEAEQQSILATFPRYRDTEKKYGSLIRGTREQRKQQKPGGQPAFMTLTGGTQMLIEALAAKLSGSIRLNVRVTRIDEMTRNRADSRDTKATRNDENDENDAIDAARPNDGFVVTLDSGEHIEADAVLITTPAYNAAELVRPVAAESADLLASIRYLSSGTISLAYRAEDVKRPLEGFGLIIPPSEARPINAITITSSKFDLRAPEDRVLLRVFFGGSRSPQTMALDDAELIVLVRAELKALLGIEAAPLLSRVYRWNKANPQYDLGHLDKVAQIEAALPPGIAVTGSAYRGVGLPDCIQQAQQNVQKIIQGLRVNQP